MEELENRMGLEHRYFATQTEVQQVCAIGIEEARKISADLQLTHDSLFAYYLNRQEVARADAAGMRWELRIALVDEPQPDQPYVLAPYCNEGETALVGIALWRKRAIAAQ